MDEATTADIAAVSESVVNACKSPDGAYYEYPLCMTTHCMAINYEVFEAADALQYIDERTAPGRTEDFLKAIEAVKDSGRVSHPRHRLLRRPGRRPGHPRAGDQPVRRRLHQRRPHRVHRQQR